MIPFYEIKNKIGDIFEIIVPNYYIGRPGDLFYELKMIVEDDLININFAEGVRFRFSKDNKFKLYLNSIFVEIIDYVIIEKGYNTVLNKRIEIKKICNGEIRFVNIKDRYVIREND